MIIPKTIHQFWIGDKKMPIEWMNTWQEKNPLLKHIIWDEKKIDKFGLKNKDKYDYFIKKEVYDGAIDIARVEILNRFGGIYVDADSICINSIENEYFMEKDFFAAIEYDRRVGNSVIGTKKGHSIIKEYLNRITEAKVIEPPCYTIGGTMLTTCIDIHGKDNKIVILPKNSFYPKNYTRNKFKIKEKVYAYQMWGSTKGLYINKK